jgi:hypothetical protein
MDQQLRLSMYDEGLTFRLVVVLSSVERLCCSCLRKEEVGLVEGQDCARMTRVDRGKEVEREYRIDSRRCGRERERERERRSNKV